MNENEQQNNSLAKSCISNEFSVLDPQFALQQYLFLEASAGTGKTFAIQHLTVRTLLESEEALLPKQCAIVTFTRAVAEELVSRISQTLDDAIRSLKNKDAKFEYLAPYIHDEGERLKALNRLVLFQRDVDRAKITTIHGFCLDLLSRYQATNGIRNWLETNDVYRLVGEILQYEISKRGSIEGISAGQFQAVRKLFDFDDIKLIKALIEERVYRTTLAKKDSLNIVVDRFFEKGYTPQKVMYVLSEYSKKFQEIRSKSGDIKGEVFTEFKQISNLFDPNARSKSLYVIEKNVVSLSRIFSKPLKKPPSVQISTGEISFVEDISEALDAHISQETVFIELKRMVIDSFEKIAAKRGFLTPDLLLKRAAHLATMDEDFCRQVRSEYRLVIVDEFQDTDPQQWSIISNCFLNSHEHKRASETQTGFEVGQTDICQNDVWPGSLYLVGDPKQSIYSFRSSDVYSYLEAKSKFASKGSLKTNFRSTQEVVTALNTIFSGPASRNFFKLPRSNDVLLVDEVKATKTSGSEDSPVEFHFFYDSIGRKKTWPHEGLEERQLFPWLVSSIQEFIKDGYRPSQIAILVNDRYQAARIESYLEANSIAVSSLNSLSVLDTPACHLLTAFYSWLASPKSMSKLKILLSFQKGGYRNDIFKLLEEGSSQLSIFGAYVDEVEAIMRSARIHGFAAAFDRWLLSPLYPSSKTWAQELSELPDAISLFRDCTLILDLLSEKESEYQGSMDANKAYQFISELESSYGYDSDRLNSRFDVSREAIRIVTTYKSKGLEFDVVIPLGTSTRARAPSRLDLLHNQDEREAEKARLLYVALTRARKRLRIPVFIDLDLKECPQGTLSPIESLFESISLFQTPHRSDQIASDLINAQESSLQACKLLVESSNGTITLVSPIQNNKWLSKVPEAIPTSKKQIPIERRLQIAVHSRSALWTSFSHEHRSDHASIGLGARDDFGRLKGVEIHSLIQRLIDEAWELVHCEKSLRMWIEKQYSSSFQLFDKSEIVRLVLRLLSTKIQAGSETITLKDIPKKSLFAEVPFSMKMDDKYLQGAIDAIAVLEHGVIAFDWKTHLIDSDCSQQELLESFQDQASLYKRVLSVWAKDEKPVLGIFFMLIRSQESDMVYDVPANFEGEKHRMKGECRVLTY